jgi:PAS domain S-box-containing protein
VGLIKLTQAEQRLAIARRHAGVGTWEWDLETNGGKWSDEVFSIYGYEPKSFPPAHEMFEKRVHPDDREIVRAAERRAIEGDQSYEVEFRAIMPDGEIKHVSDSGVITRRDSSGKALYMTGIVQNISARKRAEQAIADSERHYRNLFESSRDGIMIADGQGLIEDANPAVLNMLGYDIAELRGKNVDDITPPEWRAITQEKRVQIQHQPQGEYEKEYIRRDGTTVPVTVHVWPIGGPGGSIMAIIRDVTTSKQVEAQLRQAQKMEAIGQLTGGIAHDFNNLLTVVMGNLEIVSDRLPSGSEVADKVSRAYRAAGRGANLTHQLLAFSRKQALSPTRIEPGQLVSNMRDMLRVSLEEAVDLLIRSSDDLWPCRADRAQLESTILNLTINARDAMPKGGTLIIKTENVILDDDYAASHDDAEAGEYVMFSVSDTGCGIAPDVLEHVFEPFFTTKEVGAGSGLGLSMIYGFAKQSGGHVTIESEVGRGTVVKHYLPRWTSA